MDLPISNAQARAQTDPGTFWATAASARTIERLKSPAGLEEAAERLAAFVLDLRCAALAAASPVGQKLALTVAAKTKLPMWTPAATMAGRIAVLDAAVNSGVNIVRVIRAVRASGADDVVGVALVAQAIAVTAWDGQGETLAALEEI